MRSDLLNSRLALSGAAALIVAPIAVLGATPAVAAPAANGVSADEFTACAIEDASLTWGFKESFRSYISGSIAKGEWIVSEGAAYATPDFQFTGGTGQFDPATGELTLAFPGAVQFLGHNGLLNTTIANPTISLVDGVGVVGLDVTGTTQEGEQIAEVAIPFGSFEAETLIAGPGTQTIEAAATTLTAEGAVSFGTYPEGEALDPVTISVTLPDLCGAVNEPVDETETAEPEPEVTAVAEVSEGDGGAGGAVIAAVVGGVAALLAAVGITVGVVRSRAAKRAAAAQGDSAESAE